MEVFRRQQGGNMGQDPQKGGILHSHSRQHRSRTWHVHGSSLRQGIKMNYSNCTLS